ncbi:hypothetical protein IAD21_01918 [Abditibacteriota bacterium]|nr:hypothetical protein IAD21_01918 [Abditibacteriota bacterium]
MVALNVALFLFSGGDPTTIKKLIYIVFMPFSLGFFIYRLRHVQRTPIFIFGFVVVTLQYVWRAANMLWGEYLRHTIYGQWVSTLVLAGVVAFLVINSYLGRRNITRRPWQSTPLYKKNPVAAEQEYRLAPLLGSIGILLIMCVSMITLVAVLIGSFLFK